MSSTGKSQDISNCLSAKFDQGTDGSSPGSWAVCYNANQKALTLTVNVGPSGNLIELSPPLVSTIDSDGLVDMINFLCQVKLQLNKQTKSGGS